MIKKLLFLIVALGIAYSVSYALFNKTDESQFTPKPFSRSVLNQAEPPTTCEDCNVIIISIDTLRADHIGTYGYFRDTTPNIDSFAKKSVVFENHFANSATSAPSHMSIFTSLYPDVHRVLGREDVIAKNTKTLTEILKDYGYITSWFHAHDPELAPERGYKGFDERFYQDLNSDDHAFTWWLRENRDKKFFTFLHSSAAHDPYLPKEPNVNIFDPYYNGNGWSSLNEFLSAYPRFRKYWESNDLEWHKKLGPEESLTIYKEINNLFFDAFDLTKEEDLHRLIALYDEEVLSVDLYVKKVFDLLEELSLTENTIIILTTDHGEAFLEHGNLSHQNLYDENIQAALIMHVPGQVPKRIDSLSQSIDIVPTLFDYLAIEPEISIQGKSLIPAIENNEHVNKYIFSEFNGTSAIRSLQHKLINVGENLELYDLEKDPQEKTNISTEQPEITKELHDLLLLWKISNTTN